MATLKCPECKDRTYKQVGNERAWCHRVLNHKNKKPKEMK